MKTGARSMKLRSALARDTTLFVVASPRSNISSSESLVHNVESSMAALSLQGSQVVVLFDAVKGRAVSLPPQVAAAYSSDVSAVRRWAHKQTPPAEVTYFPRQLGKAEMLWAAFQSLSAAGKATPLVAVLEEDSEIVGDIDADFLHKALRHDPAVEYVRFYWHSDCTCQPKQDGPCWLGIRSPLHANATLHADSLPCSSDGSYRLLQQLDYWSDRPHLATWDHYTRRIFPLVIVGTHRAPESYLFCTAPDGASRFSSRLPGVLQVMLGGRILPNLWLYGARGAMRHDVHHSKAPAFGTYPNLTGTHNFRDSFCHFMRKGYLPHQYLGSGLGANNKGPDPSL